MNDNTRILVTLTCFIIDACCVLPLLIGISSIWFFGLKVIGYMFDEKSRERDRKKAEKAKKAQGPNYLAEEQLRTERIMRQVEEDWRKV